MGLTTSVFINTSADWGTILPAWMNREVLRADYPKVVVVPAGENSGPYAKDAVEYHRRFNAADVNRVGFELRWWDEPVEYDDPFIVSELASSHLTEQDRRILEKALMQHRGRAGTVFAQIVFTSPSMALNERHKEFVKRVGEQFFVSRKVRFAWQDGLTGVMYRGFDGLEDVSYS